MFLFVGEERSEFAKRKGWTWHDGRLAAKQLFDALDYSKIPRSECLFVNWFESDGPRLVARLIEEMPDLCVVAMGQKVERALAGAAVVHRTIVHPAARGQIRRKATYCEHVRTTLLGR